MCVWSDRDTCWGMTWQLQQVPACNCHGLVSPRLTCIFSLHLTVYVITVSLLKRLQNNNKKRNDDTQIDLPDLVMLFTVGDNVLMPHCMDNCWNACGSKRYCSLISFTVNHWGCFFFLLLMILLGVFIKTSQWRHKKLRSTHDKSRVCTVLLMMNINEII